MLCLVLVFSAQIIDMIVSEKAQEYALSARIAKILALGMIGQFLWQHLSFGVAALGKPEYGFVTRLISAVLLLPVGYWLTVNWGVTGAAWSRAVGEVFIFILSTIMLYRAAAASK